MYLTFSYRSSTVWNIIFVFLFHLSHFVYFTSIENRISLSVRLRENFVCKTYILQHLYRPQQYIVSLKNYFMGGMTYTKNDISYIFCNLPPKVYIYFICVIFYILYSDLILIQRYYLLINEYKIIYSNLSMRICQLSSGG